MRLILFIEGSYEWSGLSFYQNQTLLVARSTIESLYYRGRGCASGGD